MGRQDEIISYIQSRGPVLPSEVKEYTKDNMLITGAYLSELVAAKRLNLTHAKIGGSPLYYLPNQREQLSRLFEHLNEKDKEAYQILEEKKIVRDDKLPPLYRAGMRQLKDFATGLTINVQGEQILFWKWHLVSQEEAINRIRSQFAQPDKPAPANKTHPKRHQLSSHQNLPKKSNNPKRHKRHYLMIHSYNI